MIKNPKGLPTDRHLSPSHILSRARPRLIVRHGKIWLMYARQAPSTAMRGLPCRTICKSAYSIGEQLRDDEFACAEVIVEENAYAKCQGRSSIWVCSLCSPLQHWFDDDIIRYDLLIFPSCFSELDQPYSLPATNDEKVTPPRTT